MKERAIMTLAVLLSLILLSCKIVDNDNGGNGNGGDDPENPIPILQHIRPNFKVSHMPTFTLTVRGKNFISSSKIIFNGIEKQTSFVDSTELTCQIDPSDTVLSESMVLNSMNFNEILSESVPVKVQNLAPGSGVSDSLSFMIHSNHAFEVPYSISNTAGRSRYPDISSDTSGNINVVWEDDTSGYNDIYFCRSPNYGLSWDQAVNISNTAGNSHHPAISTDTTGNINVVWEDDTSGYNDIYFSRSSESGLSWSQAVNISNSAGDSSYPAISTDPTGNINVVWARGREGGLQFCRSTNNGLSWSMPARISYDPYHTLAQVISTDAAGNINVAWQGSDDPWNWDIYFSRSIDSGLSWSLPLEISNDPLDLQIGAISTDPAGNINVVWGVGKGSVIYFCRSSDNGLSWSQPVRISNPYGSDYPAMSTDPAGNINVVWEYGGHGINYSRSIDNGLSWSMPADISNTASIGRSQFPAMSTDSAGNINIVWQENYPGLEIFFTGSKR